MDPCGNTVSIAQEIEVFDPGLELGRQLTGTSVTSKDTNCFFNKPVGHQLEKKEEKKNKKKKHHPQYSQYGYRLHKRSSLTFWGNTSIRFLAKS